MTVVLQDVMIVKLDEVAYNLEQIVASAKNTLFQSFWFIESSRKHHLRTKSNCLTHIRLRNVANNDYPPLGVDFSFGKERRTLTVVSAFIAMGNDKLNRLIGFSVVSNTYVDRCCMQGDTHFNSIITAIDQETELLEALKAIKRGESVEDTFERRKAKLQRLQQRPNHKFDALSVSNHKVDAYCRTNKLIKLNRSFGYAMNIPLMSLMLPCRHDGKSFVDVDWFSVYEIDLVLLVARPIVKL